MIAASIDSVGSRQRVSEIDTIDNEKEDQFGDAGAGNGGANDNSNNNSNESNHMSGQCSDIRNCEGLQEREMERVHDEINSLSGNFKTVVFTIFHSCCIPLMLDVRVLLRLESRCFTTLHIY